MKTSKLKRPAAGAAGVMACLGLFLGLAQAVSAQTYQSETVIPVTFYDFRSNRSNPEFEQPHGKYNGSSKVMRPGMVDTMLDLDGKPKTRNMALGNRGVMNSNTSNNPYLNYGMRFWFRDWSKLSQYEMMDLPHESGNLATAAGARYLTQFRPVYEYMYQNGNWGAQPVAGQNVDWSGSNIRGGEWDAEQIRLVSLDYSNNGGNAFENRVVPAELTFMHVPNVRPGMYEFRIANFFPLRGGGLNTNHNGQNAQELGRVRFRDTLGVSTETRGFTNDTWASTNGNTQNNYAFTMEMVCKFKMEDGLEFTFIGDDDVWIFINNKLALDIGGIHEQVEASIRLNDHRSRFGLVNGQSYELRMFYSERHADGSSIRIQTNIVSAMVTNIKINVDGSDMIAGVPKLATALVEVDTGAGRLTNFDKGFFSWTYREDPVISNQKITLASAISKDIRKSDSINVTAEKAHTYLWIIGEYCDTTYGASAPRCVKDSARVLIRPGPAAKIFIEDSPDSTASLRDSNQIGDPGHPRGAISISTNATYQDNFFAIIRDQFGNWVSWAAVPGDPTWQGRIISWNTIDSATAIPAVAVMPPSIHGVNRGQGRLNRLATSGQTRLNVNYRITTGTNAGFNVTSRQVPVIIESITYTAVRVGVRHAGTFIVLSEPTASPNAINITLDMTVGSDTTLEVQGRRSDNDQWEATDVMWTSTGVPGLTPPLSASYQWSITPTGETSPTGTVTATVPNSSPSISAPLTVRVVNRDPAVMRFFNRRGTPNSTEEITSYVWPAQFPAAVRPYPVPNAEVTVSAGNALPLTAKLFTALPATAGTWLQDLENPLGAALINRWVWSFVPGTPVNAATTLSGTSGDSITFRSTAAHHTYQVRAVYTAGSKSLEQIIYIRVVPSMENIKLVIEPNSNGLSLSPNASQKVDPITFADVERSKIVYAVIRDQYDNFVCFSGGPNIYDPASVTPQPTQWSPAAAAGDIITASRGNDITRGEGVVEKNANTGETWLKAHDLTYNKRDSVRVNLLGYGYSRIVIAEECPNGSGNTLRPGYCQIETLNMTTNDTKTIYVFGERTDCGTPPITGAACWEAIEVDWGRSVELVPAFPTTSPNTPSWTLNPQATGTGQITATNIGSNLTTSIPAVITVGPPLEVRIKIIPIVEPVPGQPIVGGIAGQPIRAEVSYYNRNGLITEWPAAWGNISTHFKDTLVTATPAGPQNLLPQVFSGGVTLTAQGLFWLNDNNHWGNRNGSVAPRSVSGLDTVEFIIYNATDVHGNSLTHQIYIRQPSSISGIPSNIELSALSERFTVRAGPPAGLKIESDRGDWDGDTLILKFTDPPVVLSAVAEDQYGNKIGVHPSDWQSTVIDQGVPTVEARERPLVVYTPGLATENGKVIVCATASDNTDANACITVKITGVTLRASSVTTRDYSGCGYLDAIELKFRKPVKLTASGKFPGDKIRITRGTTSIAVDSVTANAADSSAIIWLKETGSGPLQTGWRPQVSIFDGVFEEAGEQVHCGESVTKECAGGVIDGAAPVIETAKLFFPSFSGGGVKENYIEVRFSENIFSSNNRQYNATEAANFNPEMLFNIWELAGSDGSAKRLAKRSMGKKAHNFDDNRKLELKKPDPYLAGIEDIIFHNATTLRFYLRNERELGPPRDYINIRTDPRAHVLDAPYNVPGPENRRVPITYGNPPNEPIRAIPNPASPADRKDQEAIKINGG
ncbi:MAG: fibro-slime domain-containing protein, partial [Chitinispirillia bacterium]|nr:fibro-slime domain-containing protein [Chitinispirillia bacterium]